MFWVSELVFVCLNFHVWCLNLYLWCLNLSFWCMDLYFGCMDLYFLCMDVCVCDLVGIQTLHVGLLGDEKLQFVSALATARGVALFGRKPSGKHE